MPWGYALRSYCVGGTKYAVGIRSTLVLCKGYQICRGDTLYARTVWGVPNMPWGYALRSYCVGGTKYAVYGT